MSAPNFPLLSTAPRLTHPLVVLGAHLTVSFPDNRAPRDQSCRRIQSDLCLSLEAGHNRPLDLSRRVAVPPVCLSFFQNLQRTTTAGWNDSAIAAHHRTLSTTWFRGDHLRWPVADSHHVGRDHASTSLENVSSLLFLVLLISARRPTKHHVLARHAVHPPIQADVRDCALPFHVRERSRLGDLR